MKRIIIITALALLGACGLLLSLAPDSFSIIILAVMCLVIGMGFFLGLMPAILFAGGFKTGCSNVAQTMDVQSDETWIAVFKLDSLFHQKELDQIFRSYKNKVEEEKEYDEIESDIEEYINEEFLSLRTWQGLVLQIPGILTGLGILGTFLGLITGISSIGFSSVDAAIESISVLLSGIETAFYTSIAGVILSILFNILNRLIWNSMLREYGLFIDQYHKQVIPSAEEITRTRMDKNMKKIINRIERMPKSGVYSLSRGDGEHDTSSNELMLMPRVIEGLQNNEFTFCLQPRIMLSSRKIQAAEALVRWNHPGLGILAPSSFIPMLEKNGFITKLDAYIWELVFSTVRKWIDEGIRPVPITLNVSKTDLLVMDVPEFFAKMLDKYKIPPRTMEIEIARNAFVQSRNTVMDVAEALRRQGFKVVLDGFDGDYIAINMLDGIVIDALKLDLRFMPEHEYNSIEAIFEQAKRMNIEISAEGVENTEQITYLKNAGCTEAQGYYFFKPMSIEEFEETMAKRAEEAGQ